MSYPAQNTDTEFRYLIEEVLELQKLTYNNQQFGKLQDSISRLRGKLGNRRYEELFLNE
jgi:hypothetical protein